MGQSLRQLFRVDVNREKASEDGNGMDPLFQETRACASVRLESHLLQYDWYYRFCSASVPERDWLSYTPHAAHRTPHAQVQLTTPPPLQQPLLPLSRFLVIVTLFSNNTTPFYIPSARHQVVPWQTHRSISSVAVAVETGVGPIAGLEVSGVYKADRPPILQTVASSSSIVTGKSFTIPRHLRLGQRSTRKDAGSHQRARRRSPPT